MTSLISSPRSFGDMSLCQRVGDRPEGETDAGRRTPRRAPPSAPRSTTRRGLPAATAGKVTFRLCGHGDAKCSKRPTFSAMRSVSGDGSYPSASFTPAEVGTYRFTASHSGDGEGCRGRGNSNPRLLLSRESRSESGGLLLMTYRRSASTWRRARRRRASIRIGGVTRSAAALSRSMVGNLSPGRALKSVLCAAATSFRGRSRL